MAKKTAKPRQNFGTGLSPEDSASVRLRQKRRSAAAKKGWETRAVREAARAALAQERRERTEAARALNLQAEPMFGLQFGPKLVVPPALHALLLKDGLPATELHLDRPLPPIASPNPWPRLAAMVRGWWLRATGWWR